MNHKLALFAVAALATTATPLTAQDPSACWLRGETSVEDAQNRASPLGVVAVEMDGETMQICYSRPSARDRTVMGELVPFGQIWRLGANEATQVHLPFDARIGGVEVPAGVYSLYAIPGEDEWDFFLSGAWERWGIPVDENVQSEVVASFSRGVAVTDDFVETFTISWASHGETMGHLVLAWENTRVEVPVHHGSMGH